MAEIRVENLQQGIRRSFVAVQDSTFTVEDGEFFVHARAVGLRQDDDAAHDRRARTADLRPDPARRRGRRRMRRARERDIAFVFQLFALYPHMNVRKNIGFPLLAQGMPRAEIKARVEETAKLLRIDHLLDKPVSGLAGGDRQRVALGRAIVRRPKCFLMDEPLGTLDTEFRDLMVRRAARAAQPHPRHHGLCHARPDGGHVDGRQDRRDEQRRRSSSSARRRRSTTVRPRCSSPISSARRR